MQVPSATKTFCRRWASVLLPPRSTTGAPNTHTHTHTRTHMHTCTHTHTHICPPKCSHGHRKPWNTRMSSFIFSSPLPHLSAREDTQPESRRTCYHLDMLSFRTFLPLGAADQQGPGRALPRGLLREHGLEVPTQDPLRSSGFHVAALPCYSQSLRTALLKGGRAISVGRSCGSFHLSEATPLRPFPP